MTHSGSNRHVQPGQEHPRHRLQTSCPGLSTRSSSSGISPSTRTRHRPQTSCPAPSDYVYPAAQAVQAPTVNRSKTTAILKTPTADKLPRPKRLRIPCSASCSSFHRQPKQNNRDTPRGPIANKNWHSLNTDTRTRTTALSQTRMFRDEDVS